MYVLKEDKFVELVMDLYFEYKEKFESELTLSGCYDYIINKIVNMIFDLGYNEIYIDIGGELYSLEDPEVLQLVFDMISVEVDNG